MPPKTKDMPPTETPSVEAPKQFLTTPLGQRYCGQCSVHPMPESATSFSCDHGAWQGTPGAPVVQDDDPDKKPDPTA